MEFYYIKALHIIFAVTWFAGLFYMVRLFVYHFEANEKKEESIRNVLIEQYKIMEKRLWYGIAWPSMILTLIFGIWMLIERPGYLNLPWMHLKLAFILGLILYHFSCHHIFKQLKIGLFKLSSFKMRVWNEVATLFLVAIVFIVILKDTLSWIWGIAGLVLFAVFLMLAIKWYKKMREGKKTNT